MYRRGLAHGPAEDQQVVLAVAVGNEVAGVLEGVPVGVLVPVFTVDSVAFSEGMK